MPNSDSPTLPCSVMKITETRYVKEGPAELQDNRLVFTKIPPRSKFPVKVTVVAWQYGIAGQVQTAEPVERSFFITK